MKISSEDVRFACADGVEMAAYVARPELGSGGDRRPGIILVHEAFGVNEQIRGVTRRYAAQGFRYDSTKPLCQEWGHHERE